MKKEKDNAEFSQRRSRTSANVDNLGVISSLATRSL